MALIIFACQIPFAQTTYIKRDRYGESPVYDMRNGRSYMEWRYDEAGRVASATNKEALEHSDSEASLPQAEDAPDSQERSWFSQLFD
jgi:hypothetical protein